MSTYLVPFKEVETVLVGYEARVHANSKEEAFYKIASIIEDGDSPHNFTDTWDNQDYDIEAHANLGIIEHISSDCVYNMEEYCIDDVEEFDERISASLSFTAFDIARLGKDEICSMVEESFRQIGLNLEILEMDMVPTKIEEHFVSYDCIPTEYRNIFSDDSYVHIRNGVTVGGNL